MCTLQNMCPSYYSIWVLAVVFQIQRSITLLVSQRVEENAEKSSFYRLQKHVTPYHHRKLRL